MAYPIGSISKQFTATAILILQQQGKLSLKTRSASIFPELTRSHDVKIINLLTHTSGYQDYAPQDYTIPAWKLPGNPLKVVHEFAGKPLDFDPGTQWQYSNTNFVLAALIVQKVSGEPFAQVPPRQRPQARAALKTSSTSTSTKPNSRSPATCATRSRPSAPPRSKPPAGTSATATWPCPSASSSSGTSPSSTRPSSPPPATSRWRPPSSSPTARTPTTASAYEILNFNGRKVIEHSGEVGGFVAENILFPDEHVAIAVLTNQEASGAAADITKQIAPLVLPAAAPAATSAVDPATTAAEAFAPHLQTIVAGLQKGNIDRSLFTANCNDYFDATALADYQSSLAPLGTITSVTVGRARLRGGMTFSSYRVAFSGGTTLLFTVYLQPDGKIEQLLVEGKV